MPSTTSSALNTLSPSGVAEAIRAVQPTGISLYVHGGPGLAKSSVARQVADDAHMAFIDFRLSQVAPEDIRGVPMMGEVDHMKGVIWVPPLIFPRDLDLEFVETISCAQTVRFFNPCGSNGVPYCADPMIEVRATAPDHVARVTAQDPHSFTVTLCDQTTQPVCGTVACRVRGTVRAILALEEFNSAPPSVMAAAYQLILDRRIGDYVVPAGVMLLAMGNRDRDRGVTFALPKPVANRFVHLEMEFSWRDWFVWAGSHGIHPEVLGYLTKWPSKTYDFDPDSPTPSFATPRSWERVSTLISQPTLPSSETLRALICGAVGDAIGAEFILHRKYMADMPDIKDILSGVVTTFEPTNRQCETQIAYSICVQLCYELKRRADAVERAYDGSIANFNQFPARKAWLDAADRGFGYAVDNFRPDITIMAARLAVIHKLKFSPGYMPRFTGFITTYHEMILN